MARPHSHLPGVPNRRLVALGIGIPMTSTGLWTLAVGGSFSLSLFFVSWEREARVIPGE